jgi:glycerol-3-phosphate acyltransferase PlsY
MDNLVAILVAYSIGSIVWAVVLGRVVYHVDLRAGDNPGASGAVRTFGPQFGIVVGLFDLLKGVAAVAIARRLGVSETVTALAAGAAVAGHNWPIWFGFHGGGGLATSAGVLASFGLAETLLGIAVALVFALIYKHPRLYGRLPMSALPFGSLFGLPLMIWLFQRSGNSGGTVTAALCVLIVGIRAIGMHAETKRRRSRQGVA